MASNISVPDYVTEAIHEIARTNGFAKAKLTWSKGMEFGDGFSGQILRVALNEIDSKRNEYSPNPLVLIVKLPPEQKDYRKMGMNIFRRETLMYKEILPALMEFQEKMNISKSEAFVQYPKCHLAHFDAELDEAVIVLDDLRELKFKMENKYEVIGYEQGKLLIQTIAKFHATAIAMKHKQPELCELLKKPVDLFKASFSDEIINCMATANVEKTLGTLRKDGDEIYRKKLEWYRDNMLNIVDSIQNAEPLAVPIHGDCWINNFMFKYESENLTDIMLLDWQLSRYTSPAIDFCYFMFVCTDKSFRDQHFEEFVELYYATVRNHLKAFGCEAAELFPYDLFKSHLKRFGRFILHFAMMVIPVICTPNEDLPDTEKLMEEMQERPTDAKYFIDAYKAENNKNYVSRMSDVVRDMVDYGYL